MGPRSKGKAKLPVTNWRDASIEVSSKILYVVKEAAAIAPFSELRKVATVALLILQTIQKVKENQEAYERLGADSGGLIVAIWRSYKKAEVPGEWLSAEMREILEDLTHTLENICSFIQDQLSRNKAMRVIFSRVDNIKINEYREHLNYAMQKFELQSHLNINEVLMQLMRKNDQLSEQILHRNDEEDAKRSLQIADREDRDRQDVVRIHEEEPKTEIRISVLDQLKQVEIDRHARDEQWQSDELMRLGKGAKDRESELECLRSAASVVEIASRLQKAQEEEIAELRRKIAFDEGSSPSTTIQAQSSKKKNSSRREDEVEEEEEWEGRVIVEEATSAEEESVPSVRKGSKVNRNPSKPKRPPVVSTDDEADLYSQRSLKNGKARRKLSSASLREEDLESMRGSKIRKARGKISSTLRVEETDDEFTDEEEPLPRKSKTGTARRKASKTSLRAETEDESTDEEDPPLRKSKMGTARRKTSRTSLRMEREDESTDEEDPPPRKSKMPRRKTSRTSPRTETEDESTDEEDYASPPPRKSRKANRKPRGSEGSSAPGVDDLMTHLQGLTRLGLSSHASHSTPYFPTYGAHFSPPMVYGYGGGTMVNSGVGNVISSNISNVGNNNSVKRVYRSSSSRTQRRG